MKNVLVTVGAIEANYIVTQTLVNKGDEIVIMLPNYMQIWGISINRDYQVKTFSLLEEKDWAPDLDKLEQIVGNKTKLIAICNPNNPTGYILKESEMDTIVEIAEKYKDRCDFSKIICSSTWRADMLTDYVGSERPVTQEPN